MKFNSEIMTFEAAEAELNGWLDWKHIMPKQRESYADHIAILIEGLQFGVLTLADNSFTQNLHEPIGDITSIKYEPRINGKMLAPYLTGIKSGDGDARIVAYQACLTKQPKQIFKEMDPADTRVSNSIVVFFLG